MSTASFPTALPLRQRIFILALVSVAHGVLLAQFWVAAPIRDSAAPPALSVRIARVPALSSSLAEPDRARSPVTQPRTSAMPVSQSAQPQQETPAIPLPPASDAGQAPELPEQPALPDREPDYRAAYLNNPRPEYPLSARRRGWQGRVVLDVEVLADGTPGKVAVQQSSGHDALDNAALRAVRGWRFAPARRGGVHVAQKLLVPVVFNLKEAQ